MGSSAVSLPVIDGGVTGGGYGEGEEGSGGGGEGEEGEDSDSISGRKGGKRVGFGGLGWERGSEGAEVRGGGADNREEEAAAARRRGEAREEGRGDSHGGSWERKMRWGEGDCKANKNTENSKCAPYMTS